MLRWMCAHMRKDGVRNDDIRDRVGVAPIEEKLVQHRLRWFGHIRGRPLEAPVHSGWLKHVENIRGRPLEVFLESALPLYLIKCIRNLIRVYIKHTIWGSPQPNLIEFITHTNSS